MTELRLHEPSWERMIRAVEKVRDRVLRTARALEADVGLIDRDWLCRLPGELSSRLQELLDQPGG